MIDDCALTVYTELSRQIEALINCQMNARLNSHNDGNNLVEPFIYAVIESDASNGLEPTFQC